MNTRQIIFTLLVLYFIPFSSPSQNISEYPIPSFLEPFDVHTLYSHPKYNTMYLVGSRNYIHNQSGDEYIGYRRITQIDFDYPTYFNAPCYIPDSLYYSYFSFGGIGKAYDFSYVVDTLGNRYISWYSQTTNSNCTSTHFYAPTLHVGKIIGAQYQEFFSELNGLNPKLNLGNNGKIYVSWESATPDTIDSNYVHYTSTIYYRTISPNGQLGPTHEVGQGYSPEMYIEKDGTIHIAWLNGILPLLYHQRSKPYLIQYRYSAGDSLSQPKTYRDSIYEPLNLQLYVTARKVTLISWAGGAIGTTGIQKRKVYCMRYERGAINIDTSTACKTYLDNMKFIPLTDTTYALIWIEKDSAHSSHDIIQYSDNKNDAVFKNISTFHRGTMTGFFVQKQTDQTIDCYYSNDKIWRIHDMASGNDTANILVQHAGENCVITACVSDYKNNIWLLYERMIQFSNYDIQKWIVRINSVSTSIQHAFQPIAMELNQNTPNPFSTSTIINYKIEANARVRLEIFDLLGRKVATLVDEEKDAGDYTSKFNIRYSSFDIHSGIYFYRLTVGNNVQTKKMIVMK